MAASSRKNAPQLIHEVSLAITPAIVNGASVPIGGAGGPGCCLQSYHVVTSQAFDPTTLTVALGISPGGAEILAATSIKALGRLDGFCPFGGTGPLGPATQVYATFALTGGPATVGAATIWVDFLAVAG